MTAIPHVPQIVWLTVSPMRWRIRINQPIASPMRVGEHRFQIACRCGRNGPGR